MEQTPIQKKPDDPEIDAIRDDVVNALLVEAGLPPKKSRRTRSRSSCRKLKGSEKPTKPACEPKDALEEHVSAQFDEGATNADVRLRQFLRGERSFVDKNGETVAHDPDSCRTYTLEEVGTIMGVTRERVRQIEEGALRKMWRFIRSMNMREDLTETDWLSVLKQNDDREKTVYFPGSL